MTDQTPCPECEQLRSRLKRAQDEALLWQQISNATQQHQALCWQLYNVARRAGLVGGFGACGGGEPTFSALVAKCCEAIEKLPKPTQETP
jgi:hypothetical protein